MLTRREAAIIGAYTGITMGPFSDIHKYVEEIMERPVFTHEFADEATMEKIRRKAKPDFLKLCVTDEDE
jgi:hypothetical protein